MITISKLILFTNFTKFSCIVYLIKHIQLTVLNADPWVSDAGGCCGFWSKNPLVAISKLLLVLLHKIVINGAFYDPYTIDRFEY